MFLRKCGTSLTLISLTVLLLYALTKQTEGKPFLLPSRFDTLMQFLELPSPDAYRSVFAELPAVEVFADRSLEELHCLCFT